MQKKLNLFFSAEKFAHIGIYSYLCCGRRNERNPDRHTQNYLRMSFFVSIFADAKTNDIWRQLV